MVKLDLLDKKILHALDLNARTPMSKIASQLRVSREVLSYRINRLEEANIILKYQAVVNAMNLGMRMYRVLFKLRNINEDKEKEIVAYLTSHFNWVTKARGDWDLATMVFVKDIYTFEETMKKFLDKWGSYVSEYWFSVLTHFHHRTKNYLVQSKRLETVLLHKTREPYQPDALDHDILTHLTLFGREKNTVLARKFGVDEKSVRTRIRRLEEQEIILAYSPFLDVSKLGYLYFKLLFWLSSKTQETIKQIKSYFLAHENTVYMVEGVGCADVEVEVHVDSMWKLYSIMDDARSTFRGAILYCKFVQYTNEYSFSYLKSQ